jgi:hypothetical protein
LNQEPQLHIKKLNVNRVENMGEYSLNFLRPAPPKMSIKPSKIREHLFPKYYSMPPPVDNEQLLSNKKHGLGRTSKNSYSKIFYKYDDGMSKHSHKNSHHSNGSRHEFSYPDDDAEDEDELQFQYTLEKYLVN